MRNSKMFAWKTATVACVFVLLTCVITAVSSAGGKPTDFCTRGFQISSKNHECWELATRANPYPDLYTPHVVYDGTFVEKYASHMCSVVKPEALACLRKEFSVCDNAAKLLTIADDSGGACTRNHLNPFFKIHIIDKLKPISGDSECFALTDKAYQCYMSAGDEIIQSGANTVDISRFPKVADRFFNSIWQCMIDMFKKSADVCPNWQIPMLLALQKTAMPSLFGMRLYNYQVKKLELEPGTTEGRKSQPKNNCTDIKCSPWYKNTEKTYILLRVLTEKPVKQEGDIVLELEDSGVEPKLGVVHQGKDEVDVRDYLAELMAGENQLTIQEIKDIRKEQRIKNKEVRNYLNRIKGSRSKPKSGKWKKGGKRKKTWAKGKGAKGKDLRQLVQEMNRKR